MLQAALDRIHHHITHYLPSSNGEIYSTLCYRPPNNLTAASPCFIDIKSSTQTSTLTLSLLPGTREDFIASVKRHALPADESGIKFVLDTPTTATELRQGGKWMAYAARALILRFYHLALKADSLDILLVLAGYTLMHLTFFSLLRSSRALGSNFWLVTGILASGIVAFIVSLPIAFHLGISVDPVLLTESLPFLVCTIGFEKPLRLARAVFTHEHLHATAEPGRARARNTMKPASEVVLEALDRSGNAILRDYAMEIFVLILGAWTRVGGLRECCALAALILGLDCLALGTFYLAILCVMVEVSRFSLSFSSFGQPFHSRAGTSRGLIPKPGLRYHVLLVPEHSIVKLSI